MKSLREKITKQVKIFVPTDGPKDFESDNQFGAVVAIEAIFDEWVAEFREKVARLNDVHTSDKIYYPAAIETVLAILDANEVVPEPKMYKRYDNECADTNCFFKSPDTRKGGRRLDKYGRRGTDVTMIEGRRKQDRRNEEG